jgi:hypothetical protein
MRKTRNKNTCRIKKIETTPVLSIGDSEKISYPLLIMLFIESVYLLFFDDDLFNKNIGLYFGSLLIAYIPITIISLSMVFLKFKGWMAFELFARCSPIAVIYLFILFRINYFEISSYLNFTTGVHPDNFSFYIEFLSLFGAFSYLLLISSIIFFTYSIYLKFNKLISTSSLVNRLLFSIILIIPVLPSWPPFFISNDAIDSIIHDETSGVFGYTKCLGHSTNSYYLSIPNGYVLKYNEITNTYEMSKCDTSY